MLLIKPIYAINKASPYHLYVLLPKIMIININEKFFKRSDLYIKFD